MSNTLWNEILLLKRYKLFNYDYFIIFNPSFSNYLRKMYFLYNKDLKFDFISLPIQSKVELETQNEQINKYKNALLGEQYFVKYVSQLTNIFLKRPPKYNGKIPYLKWKRKLMLENRMNFEKYTKLFERISYHMFRRYINMNISISTLDKIILSLKIFNFIHLHILICLVAAFIRLILYLSNENEKRRILRTTKTQKVKYKRFSV